MEIENYPTKIILDNHIDNRDLVRAFNKTILMDVPSKVVVPKEIMSTSKYQPLSRIKDLEKEEIRRTSPGQYGYYFIEWQVEGPIGRCYTINNNFDDE